MSNQSTVSDIFRRALEIEKVKSERLLQRRKSPDRQRIRRQTVSSSAFLTIPEYDNIAPEEDWTAGLPVVLRGIQTEDWEEIAHGIVISLEQVENYPKESGAKTPRKRMAQPSQRDRRS